jgi:uncharacterized protein YkwD
MKWIKWLSLLVILSLLSAACGTNPTPKQRFTPYTEESQILGLTNAFRAQAQTCGGQQFPAAPALTWVEAVGDAAWFHSIDMARADTESHVGATALERMKTLGFEAGETAENRKKTALPGNPSDAFGAWQADPVACANLMNPNFKVMGAGYGGHHDNITTGAYWTQILTAPKTTTAPNLTVNPTTATVTVGGTAITFTATLTNSAETINFSLTGPGSFTFVGATATYTPPATDSTGTATLTATAGTLTASATITINTAGVPALSVTPTTATVTVGGAAIPFSATLTGSAETINWTLTGPGSISSTTGATTNYTPPATGGAGTATLSATAGALTAKADITINAVGGLQVEVKDLQRQVLVLPVINGPLGLDLSNRPVAPMAANPNGGAFILWTRQDDNKAFLTQVDASGNVVGTDQDLGTGNAGAVGTDGTKVAYLLKTGDNQLAFRVVGGGQTLVVDNEKAAPWPGGNVFGNQRMLNPVDFRRQAVVPVGGNWFTSFDHNNRFDGGDVHTGMSMVMLDGNGTNPTLGVPWGTSHSLDILALYDGENILNVTVGDAFPQDFRLHVLTPQGQVVGDRVDLFAKNNFDIGGDTVNSVPGTGTGVSSGKLGGLSPLGGGQFALTYLIKNQPIAAKLNEIGMLTFDKQGNAKRFKLKDGTGIKYVRSARYGANILVAWETTAGKFFAMVVDAQGAVITAEQELAASVAFSERDSFVNLANGDIMWAASVGGSLKLFRLPAP